MKEETERKPKPLPGPIPDDVEWFENFLRSIASFFENLFRSKKSFKKQ